MSNKCRGCAALFFSCGTKITERESCAHLEQDGCFVSSDEKRSFADAAIRAFTKGSDTEDHRAGDERYDRPGDREFTQLAIRSGNVASHAQG